MQQETWQVEVEGKIYETDFAGLTQWIAESSLLPDDKVRRGDLRWVEARMVPALNPYFGGEPPLSVDTAATNGQNLNPAAPQNHHGNTSVNYSSPENFGVTAPNTSGAFVAPQNSNPIFADVSDGPGDLLEIFSEPQAALIVPTEPDIERVSAPIPVFVPEQPTAEAFETFAHSGPGPQAEAAQVGESKVEVASMQEPEPEALPKPAASSTTTSVSKAALKNCFVHPDVEAEFACRQCLSLFCAECPRSIAKVRICPKCGDMCQPHGAGKTFQTTLSGKNARPAFVDPDFTFNDFLESWSYPLKFPLALLGGAVISTAMGFVIYMGIVSIMFGGVFTGGMTILVGGVAAIAFIFGCVFKAVKQIAYGNKKESFMGAGDDFSAWESILLPCLLGIGTYAIAWGPALVLIFMLLRTLPPVPDALQTQFKNVNTPPAKQNVQMTKDESGKMSAAEWQAMLEQNAKQEQADTAKRIENLISATQAAEAPVVPEAPALSREQIVNGYMGRLAGRLIPFAIGMCLALLWGLIYFPIALTVAGFTQSLGATLNPLVGLETIRTMGGNYLRAFGTYLLLIVAATFIFAGVSLIAIPFGKFGFGGIAWLFFANLASFYLYLVIAGIFGTALYRSHEKLGYTVN
jgi:hypothetical protein